MVIQSIGYGGTVTEDNTSLWLPDAGGVPYTVDGIDGFAPSVNTGTARAVTVKAGMAAGCGIRDVMDEDAVVTFDEVTSGSRWDMLVLRRSWAGAGGVTVLAVVKGTSSQNATFGMRNQGPGTVDDQPLALVQVTAGQTQPTGLIDLRVWRGLGGAVAASDSVRQYITTIGARLLIGYPPLEWVRVINPATSTGVWTIYRVDAASQVSGKIDAASQISGKIDAASQISGILPMASGGLGASNPTSARLNLGFGIPAGHIPMLAGSASGNSTQAALARSELGLGLTNGPVPILNGGTGASTAANARKALGFASGRAELVVGASRSISTGLTGQLNVSLTIMGAELYEGLVPWITSISNAGVIQARLVGGPNGRERTVHWIAMVAS